MRSNLMARLVAIADERPNVSIGHVVEHELPELRAQAEAMSAQPYLAARVAELEALLRKVEHEYTTQGWLWPTHSVIRAALAKGES